MEFVAGFVEGGTEVFVGRFAAEKSAADFQIHFGVKHGAGLMMPRGLADFHHGADGSFLDEFFKTADFLFYKCPQRRVETDVSGCDIDTHPVRSCRPEVLRTALRVQAGLQTGQVLFLHSTPLL